MTSGSLKCQHDPCMRFDFCGKDTGVAFFFQSRHWPKVALPWIKRCQLKLWPPEFVLSAIIKEGCHIVPISSMPSCGEIESKWRISISRSNTGLFNKPLSVFMLRSFIDF